MAANLSSPHQRNLVGVFLFTAHNFKKMSFILPGNELEKIDIQIKLRKGGKIFIFFIETFFFYFRII
jgi:hypothetical protein